MSTLYYFTTAAQAFHTDKHSTTEGSLGVLHKSEPENECY